MYTICPSCGEVFYFSPPYNLESLQGSYKHRFKCPNCGATVCAYTKDMIELQNENKCVPSTISEVITGSKRYSRNVDSAKINPLKLVEYEKKIKDYNIAYDRYVDLLADKLEHGSSTARNFAIAIKTIVITLFVCACILFAIAIAAFALYMLSVGEKIALSASVEYLVKFYWIYGAVGFVAGLLLLWANACIYVKKKTKVVDGKEIAHARKEWKSSENIVKISAHQFKRSGEFYPALDVLKKKKPKYAAISRQYSKYPRKKSTSTVPVKIQHRPPNFLDKLFDWADDLVGRGTISNCSEIKRCGRCRWYEAGDAQGYAPGYCRRRSQTALWGDDACDDYE